jgi:hypothetical protein
LLIADFRILWLSTRQPIKMEFPVTIHLHLLVVVLHQALALGFALEHAHLLLIGIECVQTVLQHIGRCAVFVEAKLVVLMEFGDFDRRLTLILRRS